MSYIGRRPSSESLSNATGHAIDLLLRPETDRALDTLANQSRRLILLLVKHDLVESKADLLAMDGYDEIFHDVQLIHNHLPKLDATGYITWNRETGEISKGPRFGEIEHLLTLLNRHARELSLGSDSNTSST